MEFDFKKYHYRSINAGSEAEKAIINQELKDLYESLNDAEKALFNEQLQAYLLKQYKAIGSEYEALKENGAFD
jgi:hypothetical protein